MRTCPRSTLPFVGRRTWGTGGLSQRASDGRWVGSLMVGPPGNRRRRYVSGKDKARVRAKLDRLRTSSSSPATDTLARYLEKWLVDAVTPSVRPRTLAGYALIVDRHIIPALGAIRLDRLTGRDITRWQNAQLASFSPRTVEHQTAVLRAALRQSVAWGLLDRNPAVGVRVPRVERGAITPLTADEARQFLEFVRGDPLEALYVLALSTGMRQGELLALKWSDIDWKHAALTVNGSLVRWPKDGKVERFDIAPPKTDKSRRTLPLSTRAVEALAAHQKAQRRAPVEGRKDQGFVFCRPLGSPLANWWVTKNFQATLAAAGLPQSRFHDLRHAYASMLIEEGVDLVSIMTMLGHSTIGTTVNIYGHLTAQAKQAATAKIAEILG